MARQSTKRRKDNERKPEMAPASADPRLIALAKYLARRAAERDYKDIQDQIAGRAINPQECGSDTETDS